MKKTSSQNMYKMIKIAFTIMVVLLIIFLTMRASFVAFDFGYRVFTESAIDEAPGKNVEVTIEESMDGKDIGKVLLEKGLVRDANLFWLQYKLSAYADEIYPGTYMLNTSMTAKEMMVIMSTEPEVIEEVVEETVEVTETTESTESTGE